MDDLDEDFIIDFTAQNLKSNSMHRRHSEGGFAG
jgi:hypothetical protein